MGFFDIFKKKPNDNSGTNSQEEKNNDTSSVQNDEYEARKAAMREERERLKKAAIERRERQQRFQNALKEYGDAEVKILETSGVNSEIANIASDYEEMIKQKEADIKKEQEVKAFNEWCQKQRIDPFNLSGEYYRILFDRFLTENNGIYIEEGKGEGKGEEEEEEGDESILLL